MHIYPYKCAYISYNEYTLIYWRGLWLDDDDNNQSCAIICAARGRTCAKLFVTVVAGLSVPMPNRISLRVVREKCREKLLINKQFAQANATANKQQQQTERDHKLCAHFLCGSEPEMPTNSWKVQLLKFYCSAFETGFQGPARNLNER